MATPDPKPLPGRPKLCRRCGRKHPYPPGHPWAKFCGRCVARYRAHGLTRSDAMADTAPRPEDGAGIRVVKVAEVWR